MKSYHSFIHSVNQIAQNAAANKIAHLSTENKNFDGNTIQLNNQNAVNFGSCSYLGLEFDQRVKQGAIDAIHNFGTQFSSSRAYVSLGLYEELESLFSKIFHDNHVLVTPTTTLGHLAAIPVLVQDGDAVILDHQVHSSVQNATNMLKARGIHVDMIRHNNLDMLEQKINALRPKYNKIWYMADGIYSMYGDAAPIKEIHQLMDKYDQLHFYVDDAHGMSCFGKHGAGFVLNQAPLHPKQVLAVSLAKAFATGGSVIVFPDKENCELVRACGGPMITSGPMQPSSLGAAIAVAKIHLSNEIYHLQEDLNENIKFTSLMLEKYNLPVVQETQSPVFFVGVSLPKIGNRVIMKLLARGHYLNLGIYPAVPIKNTGIRFTITRLHTFAQIEKMVADLALCFAETLEEEEVSITQIKRAFRMKSTPDLIEVKPKKTLENVNALNIKTASSISEIDKKTWNNCFLGRGTFDWDGMQFLEKSFQNNANEVNNWKFDYFLISDENEKPILATFFTTAIGKDDMLASASVSSQIEEIRKKEGADFLTSTTLMMGSMLTQGDHLFLSKSSPYWKTTLNKLVDYASHLQELYSANTILFRDFSMADTELDHHFLENGFVKSDLPASNSITELSWKNEEEWLNTYSAKNRRHLRKNVLGKEQFFETVIVKSATQNQIDHWYNLYAQVQENSRTLNTNALPVGLFSNLASSPNWEILELHLKQNEISETSAVAVIFNYKSGSSYSAMFIGVNYMHQKEFMPYRQALYQTIKRAKKMEAKVLHLGFTADFEKKRMGAKTVQQIGYAQIKDHYNMSVIANLSPVATSNKK